MIRVILALLMAGYVLSIPSIVSEVENSTPVAEINEAPSTEETLKDNAPLNKPGDLETAPSVWISYHHSLHSLPPPPLILPRTRVYTSYYGNYVPYTYWITW